MAFVSYAQNREDVMLRRALAGVTRGFYVDVGANDPVLDSVTKAFYEAGWRGINVEPVASWAARLRDDRPGDVTLEIAASDADGEMRLWEVVGTGLSTAGEELARCHARELGAEIREVTVPARTLTRICDEHGEQEIHFLKIDVEGAERSVLAGLDLARIRPWIVLVEATLPNSRTASADGWEDLLLGRGYHHVWFDGLNRFYVADERSELDAAFTTPPNVWDGYETVAQRDAREEAAAAHGRANSAESAREAAEEELRGWRERAQRAEAALDIVQRSRSWRWTAFLRSAGRVARGLLRGTRP